MKKIQKLYKEPLLHFLLLAALLFVAESIFSAREKEQIFVNQQAIDYLIKQRTELQFRELTQEEKRETIDSYIDDEILLREAYKRGLNTNDSRMRRNMILKMRGLLQGDVEEPTEEELRAFYKNNPEQFQQPALISMYQVFYRDSNSIPEGLLAKLRGGADISNLGESFGLYSRVMRRLSQRDLMGYFGPDATKAMLSINDQQWYGPIESIRGVHYVQVLEKFPEKLLSYDESESFLKNLYIMDKSRNVLAEKTAAMREDYEVVIEGEM